MTKPIQEGCGSGIQFADLMNESTYSKLVQRAASLLRREASGHPFEPADLVHEAFLRIARSSVRVRLHDPDHLVALVTIVMRRLLIDHARATVSRGSSVPLNPGTQQSPASGADTLSVHDALARLEDYEDRLFRIVEMRFFGGFDVVEIASALHVSTRTVKRDWSEARQWLQGLLASPPPSRLPASNGGPVELVV